MTVYFNPDAEPLAQGDVIDGCPVPLLPESVDDVLAGTGVKLAPARVTVMTQTCDLAQAKAGRVVVALVYPAADVVRSGGLKAAAVRDQVRPGRMYGWYFLPATDDPVSFPESLVDLRDLHTLPRAVLDHLVSQGKRVARLATPFREHLAQHFGVTYMRVALPAPYETRP